MSLFSTGLSGLSAAQTALQTTSSNISNLYTPGYNRQLTLLGESNAGGVQVDDVQRQFNQYIASQLNAATSSSSALQTYSTQVSQIDNLLADREAGLAPLMQNFFSSLEDLSGAPADPAARQGVIGTADTLTAQFRAFDSYLNDMQSGINGQIRDEVTQINNVADQMAKLNKQIALAKAKTGEAPNSLLNQRDQLVADISERIGVSLNVQDGGTYNLTIGNGQPLVAGNRSYALEAVPSSTDPSRTVIAYHNLGGGTIELSESTFDAGALGGLMTFRRETLDKTQNQIGQLALGLAEGFNAQHRLGQDLNGEQGKAFFSISNPTVFANENNASDASFSAEFNDVSQVTSSDYVITKTANAGEYEVKRVDNGSQTTLTLNASNELHVDGVTLTLANGPANEGDTFQLQPTRRLAGTLQNQIRDTAEIAAASLVNVETGATNQGTLTVSDISYQANYSQADNQATLTVSDIDSATGKFKLTGFPGTDVYVGGTLVADPEIYEFSAGESVTVNGVNFTINGKPDVDDTLTVGQFASGDNRNALALQKLQDTDLIGGRASLNEAYASMVSDVGNRTNVVKVNLDAQQGLTEQLHAVQQSESGVNLDEEAANLIRYQQYYQANAKVIQTGGTLLDTILDLR